MMVSRLLKSCATPPVSWPTASSFCAWRSASCARFSSVMSRPSATSQIGSPRSPGTGLSEKSTIARTSPAPRISCSSRTVSPAAARSMPTLTAAWSSGLPRIGAASQNGLPTMSAGVIWLHSSAVRLTSTTVPADVRSAMNCRAESKMPRNRRWLSASSPVRSATRRSSVSFNSRSRSSATLRSCTSVQVPYQRLMRPASSRTHWARPITQR